MPPLQSRWPDLRATVGAVERWILPGECLVCHELLDRSLPDALICGPCRNRWTPLPLPTCPRCGQPVTTGIPCRICQTWPAGFGGVASAFWLESEARHAVHLLKYAGWWRVATAMAAAMRRVVMLPENATLVPIPLGATRLRERGYNQSAALAEALGRHFRLPVDGGLLRRRRETTTQTALTPEERRANLAGAFAANRSVAACPVLVDDVFTTGATLAEAAVALLAAGAPSVSGITFARAPRPLADATAALHSSPDTIRRSRE